MNVMFVANASEGDGGLIESLLAESGARIRRVFREDFPSGLKVDNLDLLVLLGSSWSLAEPSPAVKLELQFLESVIRKGVPVFGVCFGAQLLSTVLGGTVTRSTSPEIGWCQVRSVAEVPCVAGLWMQWHYDLFSVPNGSELLAVNEVGPQSFCSGRSLGTQFHPEITPTILESWISNGGYNELLTLGLDPDSLFAHSAHCFDSSSAGCKALFDWFLEVVSQRNLGQDRGTCAQS